MRGKDAQHRASAQRFEISGEGAMRKVHGMKRATLMAAAWLGLAGAASAEPSQDEQRAVWDDVAQAAKKGPVDVPLVDEAVLHVPAGEVFVPQPQADKLLNLFGNPGSNPEMPGLILPRDPKSTWFMTVHFQKAGYIKDDDAKTWDADEMLKSFKDGTEEQNKEREKLGEPGMEIIGWSEAPRYDSARQRLVWAMTSREIGAKADAPQTVNYNTYALGRDGYFSMNLVTTLPELPALKPVAEQQLAALEFNAGRRYADFDAKSDHVAEYGLAALVVGVAAHKLGFIALAGAFLLKFAKVIFIGLALLGGSVTRFFKRKPKPVPAAAIPNAVAPQPAFVNTVADAPAASAADLGDPAVPPKSPHGA
jgi:uncharacterized membrane-anchored protein